eukprot:TRINITY_DN12044_c0_g1_i2.p1 TRINITY_DN12044_c0_g1~~TRINITY_DN12044_c0_g1_i2.p1  ORF type:complete len:254 (-),score=52.37 TRINITY_DN12044_c0_g1_i2:120-857(-)
MSRKLTQQKHRYIAFRVPLVAAATAAACSGVYSFLGCRNSLKERSLDQKKVYPLSSANVFPRRSICCQASKTEEADPRSDGDEEEGCDDPQPGRRFRAWFLNEEDERPDYEYGTILEVHNSSGQVASSRVTVEWDGEGREELDLAELYRYEWLGDDPVADLSANLREFRQESVEGATESGAEVVAMPLEQLKRELEALRWMRQELEERAAEAEALRQENEELKLQKAEFLEQFSEDTGTSNEVQP